MSPSKSTVEIRLSEPAAMFLLGTVNHLNQVKILPADPGQALQTSAWLEEIEAKTAAALLIAGVSGVDSADKAGPRRANDRAHGKQEGTS